MVATSITVRANSAYQLLTQLSLLALGVLTAPYYYSALGDEGYGLVVLVGLTGGYLSFFELGLGQAAVRLLAESMGGRDDRRASAVIGTAATSSLALGGFGASLLVALSPFLPRLLSVAETGTDIARRAFAIGALSLFASVQTSVASAPLRALERFDLVSRISLWAALAQALTAVLVLRLGGSLEAFLLTAVAVQFSTLLVYRQVAAKVFPPAATPSWSRSEVRALTRFGGPVTVSQVAAPVLVHSEKFVIGALLGVAQLPYYSIPFSLVWTMTGVPASLGSVMFSRFARMTASGAAEESRQLAARVTRFTFAALLPAALFLIIHAEAILAVWMGAAFSGTAASSLRILALAMLVNLAAWPTYQLLQASGRPDVPAKLHVIEVVGHLPLCILLVWHSGITGAALAWLTRVGFDTLALLWAGHRHLRTGIARDTIQAISRPLGASLLLMGPAFLLRTALEDIVRGQSLIILGLTAISYVGGAVVLGLAEAERAVVVDAVRGLTTQRPKGRSRDNVPSAKHPAE